MPRCTRKGCGQEYDPAANTESSCSYHPGAPVFHEGLKSWSCCQDTNKPVLDFDEFMKIPGCTRGSHTDEAPKVNPKVTKQSPNVDLKSTKVGDKETYTTSSATAVPSTATVTVASTAPAEPLPPPEEEEDDPTVPIPPGTMCRRKGCGKAFVSDEVSRGEGSESTCTYHPLPPIFHEGSKGYLCCKRRVLEFDEFLKIQGCKQGKHLFSPKKKDTTVEELADCRIDHYQTPQQVHVSVFAKQADKDKSIIEIESDKIHFDVFFLGSKRFRRTVELFGPIVPEASSYKFYGAKIDLTLQKQDTRSWTVLEKTDRQLPVSLTFGVGGRTGTIGAKEIILDETNASRLNRNA
ncbi:chord-domain-containing protein [Panus rudis PR-1116 ss-1]|nr:chord-domain-containing protein [Panus rudis PR-1116 ss-1]